MSINNVSIMLHVKCNDNNQNVKFVIIMKMSQYLGFEDLIGCILKFITIKIYKVHFGVGLLDRG